MRNLLITCVALGLSGAARAEDRKGITLHLGRYLEYLTPSGAAAVFQEARSRMRTPEFIERLTSDGSGTGVGRGWWHPTETHYTWKWLAGRYDADQDGRITRGELAGPTEFFERLDRDRDGTIQADDLDWSDKAPFMRRDAQANQIFRALDKNGNGRLSPTEWEAFFARASRGKDHLTPDDLRDALPAGREGGEARPRQQAVAAWTYRINRFMGMLSAELGSPFEGPNLNERAPDFTLSTVDGSRQFTLSSFRGQKPVVLVFGNYT